MEQHFLGKVATKAIIVKGEEVLMTRDHGDSKLWEFPGGRINIGEDIEAALKREIMEELGIEINIDALVYSEQSLHIKEQASHLFIVCKTSMINPNAEFKIDSKELADITWVSKDTWSEIKVYDYCARALKAYWKLN